MSWWTQVKAKKDLPWVSVVKTEQHPISAPPASNGPTFSSSASGWQNIQMAECNSDFFIKIIFYF